MLKTSNLYKYLSRFTYVMLALFILNSCNNKDIDPPVNNEIVEEEEEIVVEEPNYKLPNIDLSHWKVTLPIGNPTEVHPPEILDYATNETVKPFMYNDSIEGALVFYTYPGASTANSSYSRTELREQMEPGSNEVNWKFDQGGRMKGTLALADISKDANGNFHRTIIMQIHGRLSDEQKDLIEAKDNNAPPVLKIYWYKGLIRVKSKLLKDNNATDEEILHTDAWGDDEGFNFSQNVGNDKFILEIIVSEGKMEIILNETESYIIENEDMKRWGVFENYFKAGNYLSTKDQGAFSKVKYYDLIVEH